MIDLHFHCLPGIDDGPRDWNEAVALCRTAAVEGITKIVATPHVLRDHWINDDPASDSHSIDRRPPVIAAARELVRERWGSDAEARLFDAVPSTIVNDAVLP
jgi:tyrosine-protein phosphatase YwqE